MRKESVKGSVDLLHGPILKNLIIFMIPYAPSGSLFLWDRSEPFHLYKYLRFPRCFSSGQALPRSYPDWHSDKRSTS